jgi:hypothetical protein
LTEFIMADFGFARFGDEDANEEGDEEEEEEVSP